jgi:folate-binding protein YgfZ
MLGLFWAVGPDAITFLQGILSQDIGGLSPGQAARSFLLQPRGKLDALLWVLRDEDRVGIVTDATHQDGAIASMSRWRLRVDVEFHQDRRPVLDVWGPSDRLPGAPGGWRDEQGTLVVELRAQPVRRRLIAGRDPQQLEQIGAVPIGGAAVDTFRVEAGEPRMGIDVDGRTIPQETGLVPEAVSFTKGCFLGQELVARIDSRGRVNRHLRGLRMLGPVVPPAGARVSHEGKVVGQLTTVGESPSLQAPIALALIRREALPGSRVDITWEGARTEAEVQEVPLTGRSG